MCRLYAVALLSAVFVGQVNSTESRKYFLSSWDGFGVQGSVSGYLEIDSNRVCFNSKTTSIQLKEGVEDDIELIGIKMGLGYGVKKGTWDIIGLAKMIEKTGNIGVDPISIPTFPQCIDLPEITLKKDYWVLMQMNYRINNERSMSYSYAHENEGLREYWNEP